MPINRLVRFKRTAGFTLVELMIAIVLGLLLVAAAIQLFTGGLITTRLQQANAEIQDSGIFGLDYIAQDIRLANYGNVSNPELNDRTPWGGVVLTARTSATSNVNLPATVNTAPDYISPAWLTQSGNSNGAPGLSNVAQKSDQLTIQFIAPTAMTNCEGINVLAGDLIVQRYFLRLDNNGGAGDYALVCDASTPNTVATAQPGVVAGINAGSQIIMPRVDHFHILLGTRNGNNNLIFYTVDQYRTAANTARTATPAISPPKIIAIRLAVLVRSANGVNDASIDLAKTFKMLDQTVTPANTATRYSRQVYSTTIALRNGLGEAL